MLRTPTRDQVEDPERLQRWLREVVEEVEALRRLPVKPATVPIDAPNVLSGVTSGPAALVQLGVDEIATKKSNLIARAAPTATDDNSKGYAVGSIWINVAAGPPKTVYIMTLDTTAAAEWVQIG